ncbi:hypothetical protein ACIO6U_02835 [Streptomyces sp. NPDC087422]|uniref:hypothetical protein n=1 Tax=Streptomyces sp. NPDC087422 TaxID=3365786 RepID=UPI00382CBC7D
MTDHTPTPDDGPHVCPNCEGVDPDTCFMNANRPPEQCPNSEFDGYGRQCQKEAGHNLCSFEVEEHRSPATPAGTLRDQIADALRTTPTKGSTYRPGHERFDHHTAPGRPGHTYLHNCALCRGDLDALADAVLAVVQPHLDELADYRNRITWETTCGEHARLLDACRAAEERAEKAEADRDAARAGDALWIKAYGEDIATARDDARRNREAWRSARQRARVLSAEITRRAPLLGEYATRITAAEAALARVREVARRLTAHAAGFQDVLDETDRDPWAKTVRADLNDLRTLLAPPADRPEGSGS